MKDKRVEKWEMRRDRRGMRKGRLGEREIGKAGGGREVGMTNE